jgi:hypothetical protein
VKRLALISHEFEAARQPTVFLSQLCKLPSAELLEGYMHTKRLAKTFEILGYVFFMLQVVAAPKAHAEPDLSGVWIPDVTDQKRQETANMPPWKPDVLPQVQHLVAEEKAGRPFLVLSHCLPHGMPSWMLINHNAMEVLVTPGRITMLGEGDGNRMRRIYTDGRKLPDDADESMHGYSIGHWDGDTLVVDTTSIVPQAYIAISEAAGVPNNGDMHIVERIRLAQPNVMHDDLEITAPKVLATTWKTTRIFRRYPDRHYEIAEGECAQEDLLPGKDDHGNDIYVPNVQGAYGTVHTK